jgi:hypothetical protein
LLASLASYGDKPSASAWRRVRNEALVFITTTQQLLNELGRTGGVVQALSPDDRARILQEVQNALRVVNEAIWTIHYTGDEPDDPAAAKEVFGILRPLPGLLQRAQQAATELLDMRSKARC